MVWIQCCSAQVTEYSSDNTRIAARINIVDNILEYTVIENYISNTSNSNKKSNIQTIPWFDS